MLFYERLAVESKSCANGSTKTDYEYANGTINEAETSDYSSATSTNDEETEADDMTLVNGYANGNSIAIEQLGDDGLRRRRGSAVEEAAASW